MIHSSKKLTRKEFMVGAVYYALQLIVIPIVLVWANLQLAKPFSESVVNFAFFSTNFVAVLVIFRKFLKKNWLAAKNQLADVLRCAITGLVIYFAATAVITTLNTIVYPAFTNVNDLSIMGMMQQHFGLMVIGTVLFVPIVEETFYRGLMFRSLFVNHPIAAYIVSMAAFSLVHIAGYVGSTDWLTLLLCFFQYLPAGFALAWAYHRSGTIFASVLIHTVVNLVGMLAMR